MKYFILAGRRTGVSWDESRSGKARPGLKRRAWTSLPHPAARGRVESAMDVLLEGMKW